MKNKKGMFISIGLLIIVGLGILFVIFNSKASEDGTLGEADSIEEVVDDSSEEVVAEVEVEPEPLERISLEEVTGLYVERNEAGSISSIYNIEEDFTSSIDLHPDDYSIMAYSAAEIDQVSVDDQRLELDVFMADHVSMSEGDFYETLNTYDFTRTEDSISFSLNDFEDLVYTQMELADIEAEIGDRIDFDIRKEMTNLYKESLLDILDAGNFSAF